MDFANCQSDELLDAERRLKYRGSARISLENLTFSYSNDSKLDRKLVNDLKGRFESNECFRLDIRNHIPAKIDHTVLDRVLQLSGVSADALQSSGLNGYPRLKLPDDCRLVCLDGRHRLQAASEFFRFSDNRWWTVDLYLSDISFELSTYLKEQYVDQKKPSDGEIYLKVQEYGRHPRLAHLKSRWLNMLSDLRRHNISAIGSHPKVEEALHSLLDIPGLWRGDIIAYLEHINAVWSKILSGDREKLRSIDQATVEALQLRAPGSSESDLATLRGQIASGQIFGSLPQAERDPILKRLTEVNDIIPSFASFFDDVNYHGDVVRCMQRLVPRSTKSSTFTKFLKHFNPGKLRKRELAVQTSEAVFETKDGNETSQFLVGYLQLYTYAARFYDRIPHQPNRKNVKFQAGFNEDAATLYRFAQLAACMGFDSPQISGYLSQTGDHGPAPESGISGSPALVIDGSGEPLHRRSGKPFTQNYQLDKHFFFLGHLLNQSKERGEGISSFFVLKSRFQAFFWKNLRYVNTHTAGSSQAPVDPQEQNATSEINGLNDVDTMNRAKPVDNAEQEAATAAQTSRINTMVGDAAVVADPKSAQAPNEKATDARDGSHREVTDDVPMLEVASTLPQEGSEEVHLRIPEAENDYERNGTIEEDENNIEYHSGVYTTPQCGFHTEAESVNKSATQSEVPHHLRPPGEAEPEVCEGKTEAASLRNDSGDNDQQGQAGIAPPPCVQSIEDERMSEPSSPVTFEDPINEPYRSTENAPEAPSDPSAQTIDMALDTSRPGSLKHGRGSRDGVGENPSLDAPGSRDTDLSENKSTQQRNILDQHTFVEENDACGPSPRPNTQDGPKTQRSHVDVLLPTFEQQKPRLHESEKGDLDSEAPIASPSSRYSSQGPGTPPGDAIQSTYLRPPSGQHIPQQETLDEDGRTHSALWRYFLSTPEGQHAAVDADRHVQAPHEQDGSRLQVPMENNLGVNTHSEPSSPQQYFSASKVHQEANSGHESVSLSAQSSSPRASPEPENSLNHKIRFLTWNSGNEEYCTLFDEILDDADAGTQVERLVQEQIHNGRFAVINSGGKLCSVGPKDCYRALKESSTASIVLLDSLGLTNVDDRLRESLERVQRKRKSTRIPLPTIASPPRQSPPQSPQRKAWDHTKKLDEKWWDAGRMRTWPSELVPPRSQNPANLTVPYQKFLRENDKNGKHYPKPAKLRKTNEQQYGKDNSDEMLFAMSDF
ncbi:hypothetical protein SLS56_009844 [Neofusicoccum ribis]|uniref:Uncharacterized protein n=1 Tax=Neofusicoccum ribis TaxID=45134 RepID=A0ABR3SG63_9PEZI